MSPFFVRNRFTWLAYLMLACYAYFQSGLGPMVPFLRAELGLNYLVTGLHLSAFALGMVLAGLFGDRLARRWSRRRVLWSGAAGMVLGVLALVVSHRAAFTVGSVLLIGMLGTLVMVMVQAALSDQYGGLRATALTEANVGTAIAGVLAPLVIGGAQQSGIGWRWALVLVAGVVLLLTVANFRRPVPEALDTGSSSPLPAQLARLPATFWVYWAVIMLVMAVEWCLIFWGADFMENVVGFSKVTAATLMTVFWLRMWLAVWQPVA